MPFLILLFAIGMQVFLTAKKVSPFLSLLIVSILTGFLMGMEPAAVLTSIEKGVSSTLGGLALILCLGAVLGKILEISGAAEQISVTLIRRFGEQNIQWAVLATGFLIGIPLYYNAGFVILVPLIFTLARTTGLPLLYIAIPMAASLSATHCFLPPHPGPVVLVNAFNANTGKTLLYGLIMTIPTVIVAGPLLGRLLRHVKTGGNKDLVLNEPPKYDVLPPVVPSFLIALLPVLLITISVIANQALPDESILRKLATFFGEPTIALLFSVLMAGSYFGLQRGHPMTTVMDWLNKGISGIAVILFIITAGGVLKQILIDSGSGAYIASFSSKWRMHPLVFAWVVTAMLRVTVGSATVAGITAAGVVAPLVASGTVSPELMVLAVGAGSVFGSHINDSGFWMFKEFFGLSLKQTFASWTVMETTISILGLVMVLLINSFI
ncbi:gluconate transporter [Flavisolibacter sp. BT320]|nr:gluconate transporter [Flavisolibacter longurius]